MPSQRPSWSAGIVDALGFVAGGLGGFWLGQLIGLNLFAPGYSVPALGGVILVGLGAGLGRRFARQWRERKRDET
jgi:hypothetical protein